MLVIRRINVTYELAGVAEDQKETIERVHGFHADYCPVARSIEDSIAISTDVVYV